MRNPDQYLATALDALADWNIRSTTWVLEESNPALQELRAAQARREICRTNPLLFGLCYLRRHMKSEDIGLSLADLHVEVFRHVAKWADGPATEPMEDRSAWIAPRGCGKSTLWFLIVPLWAAAYGYSKFTLAMSDSATQAEQHLDTFRRELESNEALRHDFPELCTPARRPRGNTVSDNRGQLVTQSGFTFRARGIDAGNLGAKQGETRPDLIIMDDIEPGASNYSAYQAEQRLATVLNDVLPMNFRARVVIVGTVTMPGSITHQLVATAQGEKSPDWVASGRFQVRWFPALYKNDDGTPRSVWPARWNVEWLESQQDQPWFALNMQNYPMATDGEYWTRDDFRIEQLPSISRRIISIDPAVTTKKTSDQTAIAVVSFSAAARKACVDEVVGYRLKGEPLRQRILDLLQRYPDVSEIIFESNQGGELLATSLLHDMPVPVRLVNQRERKEVRAERLLTRYRRQQVVHSKPLRDYEQQALAFPKGIHDDLVDAVGTGIEFLAQAGASRFAVASR